ncbi:MAG: hypothetical protein M9920_15585 [Verrucomicrobiae bacterium]|nr:hypothetical protein [Verrucomicrobiae bacterium]
MNYPFAPISVWIAQVRQYLSSLWGRTLLWLAAVLLLTEIVISCRTVSRVAVLLPDVPGAEYIGSKACAECHAEIYRSFQTAEHSILTMGGPNVLNAGCESCHGPGSLHSESGGEVLPPYSFAPGRPIMNASGTHPAVPAARAVETVCFNCHGEVRGQFNLASHHPVLEGQISCTKCHPPHQGSIHLGGSMALRAQDTTCLSCHPAQHGPYVFEHEAMREGCVTCHVPHGSVNAKLLAVRDANLCLKCHFQRVTGGQVLIGGADHTLRLGQGTCWTAGCHEAVHGSRVNSSLRY